MPIDPLHIMGMHPIWRELRSILMYKKKGFCSVLHIGCISGTDVQGVYRALIIIDEKH